MENDRLIRQDNLLESVLEVSNILKQRRPDLNVSIIPKLAEIQALLSKDNLSSDDLEWIDKAIGYLCHFKCLYDFCPLELLEGETDQERWQRWGQILDRMKNRANLLCSGIKREIMERKNRNKLASVLTQCEIVSFIYDMWIETGMAAEANPGQFISIYPKDKSLLLPRPISICEVNPDKTALRVVYRIAGKGTEQFSLYNPGETINILGPFGNGFPLEKGEGKHAFLIGGGIGIPPMLELSKRLNAKKQIILGYRDNLCFLKEDLEQHGQVYIATEDGSVGTKGNVLDAIRENRLEADIIYACGPMPMLRAVKSYAAEKGIPAYISLEEHMACGVGACLGCVVKTKEIHHHTNVHNARICTDGPVFEAEEVQV